MTTLPAQLPAPTATPASPAAEPVAPRRRLRRPGWRFFAAIATGLVLYASFPPWGVWWLAPFGVAGFSLVVRDVPLRRSYGLGVLASFAFQLPLLTFTKFVGLDAWLALTVAESLIFGLLAPALTVTMRLPAWPLWTACLWIGQEALRGRQPFGGFTWGRLAFSQAATPSTRLASLGGAPLVSFAVALAGALLAAAVVAALRGRTTPRAATADPTAVPAGGASGAALVAGGDAAAAATPLAEPVALPALRRWRLVTLLVLGALGASVIGLAVPTPTAAQSGSVVVAAIQGDVPARGGVDALGRRLQVTRNHVAQTLELAAEVRSGAVPAPDLVLWPENSSDLDPFQEPEAAALLTEAAQAIDRPILVGAVLDGPGVGHVRNAGLVWGPNGYVGPLYVKQHPVPFGEYLPGRSVLQKLIKRFATDMPNDFVKGTSPGVLPLNGTTISDVICFEVAYDGLVRSAVNAGGQLLVVQTNNASFGLSGESPQQLAMARLRAVEHARATVVVSTSGISAIMRPDGKIVASAGRYVPAVLVQRVPLRTSRTLADRVGVWPEVALVAVGLLALAGGIGGPVLARRRAAGASEAVSEQEGQE